jgi:hypothetical protein
MYEIISFHILNNTKISVMLRAMEKALATDFFIVYGLELGNQLGMHVIINLDQLL